jgi:hypothetical protein
MSTRQNWDARCSEILRRMAGQYHDHEIAASIEAETGKRFASRTVAGYRRGGDLPPCRRNDWTAPLKLWRAGATPVTTESDPGGAEGSNSVSVKMQAHPEVDAHRPVPRGVSPGAAAASSSPLSETSARTPSTSALVRFSCSSEVGSAQTD